MIKCSSEEDGGRVVSGQGVSGKVKETRGRWENEDRETQKGSHSFEQNCPKSTRAEREQACTAEPGRGLGLETPGTIESGGQMVLTMVMASPPSSPRLALHLRSNPRKGGSSFKTWTL